MRKLTVVVCLTTSLVALMFSPAVRAAQKSDWGAVKQLSEGQQIRIVLNDGKSYGGEFRSANDEAISARLNGDDQTFNRPSVRRISSKGVGHRGRNALIG